FAEPDEPDAWDVGRVELTATAIAATEPVGGANRPEDVLQQLVLDNERELEGLERELTEVHELLKRAKLPPHESRLRKLLTRFEAQRDRRRATLAKLRTLLGSGDRKPGERRSPGPHPAGIDFAFPVRSNTAE